MLGESTTVARWPFFRPNNSKQAGKKYLWPEKIGGRTATSFSEKWLKTGRKKIISFPPVATSLEYRYLHVVVYETP
jgi:hypothetical protein